VFSFTPSSDGVVPSGNNNVSGRRPPSRREPTRNACTRTGSGSFLLLLSSFCFNKQHRLNRFAGSACIDVYTERERVVCACTSERRGGAVGGGKFIKTTHET
jgi:hypothetical protein